MAAVQDFEKRYLETKGISLYLYLIKGGKAGKRINNAGDIGKWGAILLNHKGSQPFKPDTLFGLFDQIIKYIDKNKKPNKQIFKMK